MTAQVVDTRKRASFSSEAGPVSRQPTISEGLLHAAPAAALSSAIADFIHKGGRAPPPFAGRAGDRGPRGAKCRNRSKHKKIEHHQKLPKSPPSNEN